MAAETCRRLRKGIGVRPHRNQEVVEVGRPQAFPLGLATPMPIHRDMPMVVALQVPLHKARGICQAVVLQQVGVGLQEMARQAAEARVRHGSLLAPMLTVEELLSEALVEMLLVAAEEAIKEARKTRHGMHQSKLERKKLGSARQALATRSFR